MGKTIKNYLVPKQLFIVFRNTLSPTSVVNQSDFVYLTELPVHYRLNKELICHYIVAYFVDFAQLDRDISIHYCSILFSGPITKTFKVPCPKSSRFPAQVYDQTNFLINDKIDPKVPQFDFLRSLADDDIMLKGWVHDR